LEWGKRAETKVKSNFSRTNIIKQATHENISLREICEVGHKTPNLKITFNPQKRIVPLSLLAGIFKPATAEMFTKKMTQKICRGLTAVIIIVQTIIPATKDLTTKNAASKVQDARAHTHEKDVLTVRIDLI
jgi:hypothetical protein